MPELSAGTSLSAIGAALGDPRPSFPARGAVRFDGAGSRLEHCFSSGKRGWDRAALAPGTRAGPAAVPRAARRAEGQVEAAEPAGQAAAPGSRSSPSPGGGGSSSSLTLAGLGAKPRCRAGARGSRAAPRSRGALRVPRRSGLGPRSSAGRGAGPGSSHRPGLSAPGPSPPPGQRRAR